MCKAVRLKRDAYLKLVGVCCMCLLRSESKACDKIARCEQKFTARRSILPLDRGCYDHNACVFMGRALFLLLDFRIETREQTRARRINLFIFTPRAAAWIWIHFAGRSACNIENRINHSLSCRSGSENINAEMQVIWYHWASAELLAANENLCRVK